MAFNKVDIAPKNSVGAVASFITLGILGLFYALEIQLFLFFVLVLCAATIYLYLSDWEIKEEYVVLFFLFAGILIPPLQLPAGLPELRAEEIIAFVVFPIFIISRTHLFTKYTRLFIKFFGIFVALQIVSTIYGRLLLSVPIGGRDIFEIIDTIKFGIIVVTFSTFKISNEQLRTIILVTISSFFVSSIIGQLQYHSIAGMDRLVAPLYVQERIYDINDRMMGTFFNPNSYGMVISMGFIFTLGYFLSKKTPGRAVTVAIILGLMLWTVFLTQSRTALGILIIGIFCFLLLNQLSGKSSIATTFTALGGILVAGVGLIGILPSTIVNRYISALNIMNDPSWLMRIFAWYLNLEIFYQSPIFGWGPAKHLYTTVVDNEYILLLRRYGVVGLTSIMATLYYVPVKVIRKNLMRSDLIGVYNRIMATCLVILAVGSITNQIIQENQFMSLWGMYFGVLLASNASLLINDPSE